MKRGLSLLLACFPGDLSSPPISSLATLALFLPVIWLYAFFDSYSLRSQLAAGTAPEDAFLFGLSDMDSQRLARAAAQAPQPHRLGAGGRGRLYALRYADGTS